MSGVSNASMLPPSGLPAIPRASPGTDAGFAWLVDTQWSPLQGFALGALRQAVRCTGLCRRPEGHQGTGHAFRGSAPNRGLDPGR